MIKHLQGAVFDLDGTLLDSMWVWSYVDEQFLKLHHLQAEPDYVKKLGPMGFHRAAEYTKERFGLDCPVEQILTDWFDLAKDAYDHKIVLKNGAGEYLEKLKRDGVKLGTATSNHIDLVSDCLKHCGIYEYFDAFTVTSEVARGKNFPDVYLLAAERIGTPPQKTAVFEDILAGILGAKQGGFITVGVQEPDSADDAQAIRAAADYYIKDFYELTKA